MAEEGTHICLGVNNAYLGVNKSTGAPSNDIFSAETQVSSTKN